MSTKQNRVYQKHLTILNREDIEKLLKLDFRFYQIADKIQKHPTTISKEIINNRTQHKPSNFNNKSNFCKHKDKCSLKNICNSNCHTECRRCGKCNDVCKEYELDICPKLSKPPYVCNACSVYAQCRKIKYVYVADKAHIKVNTKITKKGKIIFTNLDTEN